ncbi:flagellar export protein FliJ [Caldimonas tepidiphila]|uniref:flagellar export protein FliJ n=1 Tax=Caldimonas tepidiphila TaxID=2315841 RepID=UPI000E5ACFB4|nr:flagellar export protein FliJ [Caldimonas tepidiphila]
MNPPQALHLVLEQAQRARDAAQAASERADQALQAAERQAAQLGQYRGEYQQRWSTRFRTEGGTSGVLNCYQGFMQRIEEAIGHQQQMLAHAARQQARARAELLQCETRVASVQRLIERRRSEALASARRHEQKTTDEQAARSAARGRLSDMQPSPAL